MRGKKNEKNREIYKPQIETNQLFDNKKTQ